MAATKSGKTKPLNVEDMAAALVYETKHGAEAAAKLFKSSARTIARRKAEIRQGKHPELAKLVSELQKAAIDRNRDLLTETFETVLRAIGEKAKEATFPDLVKAAKDLGEIHITARELGHETSRQSPTPSRDATPKGVPGSTSHRETEGGGETRPGATGVH